jgi:hypothetical protein
MSPGGRKVTFVTARLSPSLALKDPAAAEQSHAVAAGSLKASEEPMNDYLDRDPGMYEPDGAAFAGAACQIEPTGLGFHVTRAGLPVPGKVYPPAVLTFASRTHAREYAQAIDAEDATEADRLIVEHGRWWS